MSKLFAAPPDAVRRCGARRVLLAPQRVSPFSLSTQKTAARRSGSRSSNMESPSVGELAWGHPTRARFDECREIRLEKHAARPNLAIALDYIPKLTRTHVSCQCLVRALQPRKRLPRRHKVVRHHPPHTHDYTRPATAPHHRLDAHVRSHNGRSCRRRTIVELGTYSGDSRAIVPLHEFPGSHSEQWPYPAEQSASG